jgi:outer membrane murein-binding lipoprotein Lpp
VFTKDHAERNQDQLENRIEQLRKKSQSRKDKARFRQRYDTRDSNSTASLLEGMKKT